MNEIAYGTLRLVLWWVLLFFLFVAVFQVIRCLLAIPTRVVAAKVWGLLFIVGFIGWYYFHTRATAYQPKTRIDRRVEPASRFSKPPPPMVTVTNPPTWDQRMATNRAQNAQAQADFMQISGNTNQ